MNDQQQRALTDGLKALAARTRDAGASPRVEHALLEALSRGGPRQSRLTLEAATPRPFIALAAGLLVAVGIAIMSVPADGPAEHGRLVRLSGFVELPNVAALPDMESASIVRVSLPPSALAQYGMAVVPELTAGSIVAELLVAQDGHPRAIRLVQDSN